jgi:serine/threonine-protein kinase
MIGTQLENYKVLERIGEGGMGSVYRAFDVMLERDVALKFLHPDLARQPELVERFRAEAIVLARLMHPNIAHVHGLHRHNEEFYMAMEYVPGHTLSDLVRRDGRMPIARAVRIVVDVLGALEYAHRQGVVHRDIKSANVIVTPDGAAKVMDFGIARVLGSDRRTRAGTIVGTLGYMSPEQIQGFEVDGRTDLYSLGIVLFELLTGRVPFEAETEWKLMQAQIEQPPPLLRAFIDVPLSLEDAVIRALAKAQGERFQSAAEFQQAIVDLAGPPVGSVAATARATWPHAPAEEAAPADGTTLHGSAPWHVSVGTTIPAPDAEATRLATPVPGQAPVFPRSPTAPASAAPSGVKAAAPSPKTGYRRGSSRAIVMGVFALALVGAIAAAWLWFGPTGLDGLLTDRAAQPGTGDELPRPAAPPPPGLSESLPVAPVPPPPPVPPSQSAPAAAKPAGAGASVAGRGVPPARAGAGQARAAAGATAAPDSAAPKPLPGSSVQPATPVAAPAVEPATTSPVRFDRVKLVRQTSGGSELEVDGVLSLDAGELVVFNVTGRNPLKTLRLAAITSARYAESTQTRVFLRTRRYRLLLGAGGEQVEIRLDRSNAQQVVEAFEKRWGRPVERDAGDAR